MSQHLPAVRDPYEAHPDNLPAPTSADPFALARRTPVGRIVLADDSPFLQMAVAAGYNPAAMALELASVAARKPGVLKCSSESIIAFMLDAAKLRLSIGRGVYPVPIKGKLEAWVGYKGAKELAMRSGAIRDCWATVVYEGDTFEEQQAPIPMVTRHVFGPHKGDMRKAVKVYATLLYPGGRTRMVVFERAKIEWYRNKNRSWQDSDSPWQTAPEEMWKAKAILHSVGDLPHNSPELAHLASMLEREDHEPPADAPALPAPAPLEGPNTDEGPEDLGMSLAQALAFQLRGKNKQPQAIAEIRNSGLEAWRTWARGKLEEDPEQPRLVEIATACTIVLEARAAGVVDEPAKQEAA